MPPPRMTANPVRPARHRPGKGPEQDESSSEEEEASEEVEESTKPAVTNRPIEATKISTGLREVNLSERRADGQAKEAARVEAAKAAQEQIEEEFETEESSEGDSSEDDDGEEGSSEEESSSEDDAPKLMRPLFIKKNQRRTNPAVEDTKQEDEKAVEAERRRQTKATDLVQEQLEKQAAARAAGKKDWDDDQEDDADAIDDTDGRDPEAEYAAWKLRELKRVKREREKIESAEKEREEVERRRNLTDAERKAEDDAFIANQKEEQDERGKMAYMQKYHHKGAFFQDDLKEQGLDKRDVMGSKFADQADRSILPEYMQIRDMAKLGRKGRTRYKDLKSEDTGRWGEYSAAHRGDRNTDERFQADRDGGRGPNGPSGANATQVRERRRSPGRGRNEPSQSHAHERHESLDRDQRTYDRERQSDRRGCTSSGSRSRSRTRSPSRPHHNRERKRSPSPARRVERDKRRKVDV